MCFFKSPNYHLTTKYKVNEQLDKMDGVVEAFSVDVLKAKKLVNIGEDVRFDLHYQYSC